MINFSILISSSEISGPGGLFDFNATLPIIAIQFLLAISILNAILYNPLLTVIEERKTYILTALKKAGELLAEANKLTTQYEKEFDSLRQEKLLKSTNLNKMYQATFQSRLNLFQSYIDSLLYDSIQHLFVDKKLVLKVSDSIVKSSVDYIVTNTVHLPGLRRTKSKTKLKTK